MSTRLDVIFYMPYLSGALSEDVRSPPGGAESQILLLAEALTEVGWRVGIIVYPQGNLPPRYGEVELIQRSEPKLRRRRAVGKLAEIAAIMTCILKSPADVYVQRTAGFDTGLVGLAARARGSRFVYSSANVVDFDYRTLEPKRRNRALYELGLRLTNKVVLQTEEQRKLWAARSARSAAKATVISSLATVEPTDETEPPRPNMLLWIGRLVTYKRPHDFIRLAAACPDVKFGFLGVPSSDEPETAAAALDEVGKLANIRVFEARGREGVMRLMAQAAAIVNTAEFEGMPNIFLEGWARGVPALAYLHDPNGVIAEHGLGRFAAGDFESLVAHAEDLWAHRNDLATWRQRCQDYIRRHHSAASVAAAWGEVISGNAR